MKKLSLLFAFLLVAAMTKAQTQNDYQDYNHWSIEAQVGLTKPTRPIQSGYTTNFDFFAGDLGVRYMINELFGLKATVGYNKFESKSSSPKSFETTQVRGDLQGVANIGTLLGFRSWTNTFNLLAHTGVGFGQLKGKKPVKSESDGIGYVAFGLTPQIRLGDHFALTADGSIYGNFRQDINWNGAKINHPKSGFNGNNFNFTIGLTYYLGGNKPHADWYNREGKQFDELSNRLDQVEDNLAAVQDEVESQGQDFREHAKDDNNNGIPDFMEDALDEKYMKKGEMPDVDVMKELINNYVSVYFPFDKAEPQSYSDDALNYVVDFLKKNPSVSVNLKGYADELGQTDYNQKLSEKRADRVKDILVASGIDEGRISTEGMGENDSADKSSAAARQLVRRVVFNLN